LERVNPHLVVLYTSRATEKRVDQLYSCCPGAPLLAFHDGDAWERCGDKAIGGRVAQLLTAPMPFALRVTASWSALARRIVALQYQLRVSVGGWMNQSVSLADRVRLLNQLVRRECERRQVPLLLWPMATPDHGTPRDSKPDLAYAGESEANFHVVQKRAEIFDKLLSEGLEHTLMPPPDAHFSPRGHELVAQFLAPQIRAILDQRQQ
jgi:hypothetical protein